MTATKRNAKATNRSHDARGGSKSRRAPSNDQPDSNRPIDADFFLHHPPGMSPRQRCHLAGVDQHLIEGGIAGNAADAKHVEFWLRTA